MKITIVNENDEEICVKDRADLNPKTDIYRVSAHPRAPRGVYALNGPAY